MSRKKQYCKPAICVNFLSVEDIITSSIGENDGEIPFEWEGQL